MAQANLRNSGLDPYLYLEGNSGSTAVGIVGATDVFNIVVVPSASDIEPDSGTPSISIDPAVNGNISFQPKGTSGASIFVNGDVSITANSGGGPGTGLGNLNMEDTALNGDVGVITYGGDRFIHNFGIDNTFIGENAGNFNVGIGADNTAIGFDSLQSVTTGFENVAIGSNALKVSTTGVENTAVGYNALRSSVSDFATTAIGAEALSSLNSGTGNTAIGYQALKSTVTDINNTAVGTDSLTALNGGHSNVAVGGSTLQLSVADSSNTAVGYAALTDCNGGSFNTALGTGALFSLANTSNNTALGNAALTSLTAGGNNTVIGSNALFSSLTGTNNIAIGSSVGSSYVAAENSNIIIGNAGTVGDTHKIRIGTQGALAGQQNACNIAGISGTSITATGTVVIDAAGNLGSSASLPLAVPVTVPNGGTGQTTLTDGGVLVGNGVSAITQLTVGTNGQVLLGSTAADPVFATLTSTGGSISFTTGAGSLNIDTTAQPGITWSEVTGASQAAAANAGYVANRAGLVTITLIAAASASIGTKLRVTGINTALGWSIAQNASQQCFFGTASTTAGVTGSLASTATRDSVELVCVSANGLFWNVISSVGNITVT